MSKSSNHRDIRDVPLFPETIDSKEILVSSIEEALDHGKAALKDVRHPIVLFEPQEKYQKIIHHLLISKDYDVEVIEDLETLINLKTLHPLLFLVSHSLDNSTVAEIKKCYPEIPLIALIDENINELPPNYDAYIIKPFIPSEFMLMIHHLTEPQTEGTKGLKNLI